MGPKTKPKETVWELMHDGLTSKKAMLEMPLLAFKFIF